MTNPLWPDPSKLPFPFLGKAGETASTMPPLTQGLAGGMELIKKFWAPCPGARRCPDSSCRRSTSRNSTSVCRTCARPSRGSRSTSTCCGRRSRASKSSATPSPRSSRCRRWPRGRSPARVRRRRRLPRRRRPSRRRPGCRRAGRRRRRPPSPERHAARGEPGRGPVGNPFAGRAAVAGAPDPVVGLAANNWLGFMQDQFMKVAQAAIAPVRPGAPAPSKKAAKKRTARSTAAPSEDRPASGVRAALTGRPERARFRACAVRPRDAHSVARSARRVARPAATVGVALSFVLVRRAAGLADRFGPRDDPTQP